MPIKDTIARFKEASERDPILTIRKIVWIVLGGWVLFLGFSFAAIFLTLTIVGIPVAIQLFRFAVFALCPIGYSAVRMRADQGALTKNPLHNWYHPVTIAVNVIWLLLFGWVIVLTMIGTIILQVLSIVGIFSAVNYFKLLLFAIAPVGQEIVKKQPPEPSRTGTTA
eukprot:GEZU01029094.1.p2 GENE.GEZU01029094.1~~GEZU01029094.1.p2  ORF type:complete len:167 (-),score=26.83 GEZU01029094.1:29-529(-)